MPYNRRRQARGAGLKGVMALWDHAWLVKFIYAPDRMLAKGDPIANRLRKEHGGAPMPNLGLRHDQAGKITSYLAESSP